MEIIILAPHLKGNTTSVKRFDSIALAFKKHYTNLRIVHIEYPSENLIARGYKAEKELQISKVLWQNIVSVPASLDRTQKLAFKFLRSDSPGISRLFNWLHVLYSGTDVFYPGAFDLGNNAAGRGVVISFGGLGLSLSAMLYAKQQGYKFVQDYRDPITFGYPPVESSRIVHGFRVWRQRPLELKLLQAANSVTTVSQTLKQQFPPNFQHKIYVIPNGSNSPDNIAPNAQSVKFNIVYAGTIYDDQLKETVFFEAFRVFMRGKSSEQIRLHFPGASKSQKLKGVLKRYDLLSISNITERLEASEIAEYLANASMFLHLRYGNRSGIITSKQADYLACRKPILLPVSDHGDLAESISTHKAGFVCNGIEETVAVLEEQFQKFLNKESCIIEQDEEFLRKNTREYWAEEFVKLLDGLFVESPPGEVRATFNPDPKSEMPVV